MMRTKRVVEYYMLRRCKNDFYILHFIQPDPRNSCWEVSRLYNKGGWEFYDGKAWDASDLIEDIEFPPEELDSYLMLEELRK
jgi:hypothetical protein